MQQDVQVKGRYVVAHQDIWVQGVQAAYEVAQQSTFAGLHRQHAAAIAPPQLTLVAVFDCLLKPCSKECCITCLGSQACAVLCNGGWYITKERHDLLHSL